MQEKTLELEEEFLELWDDKEKQTPGWYIDFIRSREEKARKEGRKEHRLSGYNEMRAVCENSIPMWKEEAITQYKEELLGKLPEERKLCEANGCITCSENKKFNECLSEVKKIIIS